MYDLRNLTIDDIELNIDSKNWIDSIRKASVKLIDRKIIEEKYVDAMIDSVLKFGPYIVIAKNVALAHARPEDGTIETKMYFTTLKNDIEFGEFDNDPVKLLIVLSAKDSDSHLELLCQLGTILENREIVEKLLDAKTKEEFLNVILEALDEIQ